MKLSKKLTYLFSIFSMLILFNQVTYPLLADELTDTQNQKAQKEKEAQQAKEQITKYKQYEGTLSQQLSQMSNDLYAARANYNQAVTDVENKEQEIVQNEAEISVKEKEIGKETTVVFTRIRDLYKNSQYSPITYILFGNNLNEMSSRYFYHLYMVRQDKEVIANLQDKILALHEDQNTLNKEKADLEVQKEALGQKKIDMENQEVYLNGQIASLRAQQSQMASQLTGLQNEISSLSAKEQQILAAKAAAAAASNTVGNKEQGGSAIALPPPQKSSGDFYSFWSYGFPHRVGMNQYGAYGRALEGQTAGQILHAYFSNTTITGFDSGTGAYAVPQKIKVDGYGWIDFEELYLKGIGEMPSSWSEEALKAQAIAARTYALAYIGYSQYSSSDQYRNDPNAKSICTTQACQVFIGHIKDDRWAKAVTDTKGMVILSGGVPITAYYASTAGGSTLSSQEVWGGYRSYATGLIDVNKDGKPYDGPGFGDSPWYHKAWGDNPWLSKLQVEDMINAALLPESLNDQLPAAPHGYTPEEVKTKLQELGSSVVENLKAIEMTVGPVKTEVMKIYYNDTSLQLDPQRFRFVYNLRSPGTNAIWSSRFDVQSN